MSGPGLLTRDVTGTGKHPCPLGADIWVTFEIVNNYNKRFVRKEEGGQVAF